MQQRLPDIERTLLSAYLDGELSPVERQEAERLLESSDGARAYLRDLRAVNSVAVDAFPALPAGLAASGAIAGGKLSASAIRSAAAKGTISKGVFSSGWGLTGLAAAAAIAVVGFNLFGDPAVDPDRPTGRVAPTVQAPIAAARPLPTATVDSSSFIIPAMTPAELVDFAVEGTLPIDADRERFITVTQNGESALAVSMHGADAQHRQIIQELAGTAGFGRLDSVHQIVRTALIPYSRNSIAIRSDLPMIRLQVLEELTESMDEMPANVRQELERVRVELRGAQREVERTREMLLNGRGPTAVGAGGGNAPTRTVLYIPIESEGMRRFTSGEWTQAQPPEPQTFTLYYNRCPVVAVDPGMLEAASNAAFTTFVSERRRPETRIASAGDPTAGTPTTAGRKRVNVNVASEPIPQPPPVPPHPTVSPRQQPQPVSQDELDELLRKAEKSLNSARESLRRAEEIQKKEASGSTPRTPSSQDENNDGGNPE